MQELSKKPHGNLGKKHRGVTKGPFTNQIDAKQWTDIVAAFARNGGSGPATAEELGWPVARANRLLRNGYPKLGLPPIRTILAMDSLAAEEIRARRHRLNEQLEALVPSEPAHSEAEVVQKATVIHEAEASRVRRLVEIEEERRRAREDAIKCRAEEAMLISINRKNSLALNGVTAQMLKGAMALSSRIQVELEQAANDSRMPLREKLQLVKGVANIARFNAEASILAVKAERLVLGNPIEPDATVQNDDGSLEHAVDWINKVSRAVRRAQERGLLGKGGAAAKTADESE